METECILSDYLEQAMEVAVYDKLDDGTFAGRIPPCKGVLAFGTTLKECERLLRSTLEDWLLLGLRLGHTLPVLSGINGTSSRPCKRIFLFGACVALASTDPSRVHDIIPRPAASCPPDPDPSERGRRGFR